ncbi:hypothetical protein DAPPUDRAFT_237045 [Daphnia pulex]|uniref:Uncharacterized protein n=1 Tax=Daphnia pulex TaxID=6669 RepID=E9G2M3_DAPPU|nr:hypothetical protein DAPPUDRAFT_237045 [Daphnia pulex]|eukprot:EFX86290.1 hypothetical protein DAPPUDRAFT_237045 [Daphnia pulex]
MVSGAQGPTRSRYRFQATVTLFLPPLFAIHALHPAAAPDFVCLPVHFRRKPDTCAVCHPDSSQSL